ncbi:mitotic-spindle organizing protein 1 [Hyla sarda]|uniref:mitotic-spindle organizing protein 1 n=1 Tax=Hyla sarda TaxID=327740 RepID=UPI0024C34D51|nr:mitotic-spindle organizing protein 1 [Hyla sarda]
METLELKRVLPSWEVLNENVSTGVLAPPPVGGPLASARSPHRPQRLTAHPVTGRLVTMASAPVSVSAMRETMDVLLEISRLLNTGLDMETLSICVRLCEQGINPEALSSVIKELRRATEALKASENAPS